MIVVQSLNLTYPTSACDEFNKIYSLPIWKSKL